MMMKREDYKAVKHMDRMQMSAYVQKIYQRGYEAGAKAVPVKASSDPATTSGAEAPENEPASE